MAADGCVEPVVVLTKTDLITRDELNQKLAIFSSIGGVGVIALSAITGDGFDEFQNMLEPKKTCCLLGSSGVGKTTLINRLIGREVFETKAVSATGEGVHTISRRQLMALDRGAMLIDTPGMRELGIIGDGRGVEAGFGEIAALSIHCRYADCRHETEPG